MTSITKPTWSLISSVDSRLVIISFGKLRTSLVSWLFVVVGLSHRLNECLDLRRVFAPVGFHAARNIHPPRPDFSDQIRHVVRVESPRHHYGELGGDDPRHVPVECS